MHLNCLIQIPMLMSQEKDLTRQDNGQRWDPVDIEKRKMEDAYDRYASLIIDRLASFGPGKANNWLNADRVSWPKPFYKGSYNGSNALMLMLHSEKEGFKVPVFITRDRLNSLNYQKDPSGNSMAAVDDNGVKLPFVHVSKGSRSFPVIKSQATITHKESKAEISYYKYAQLSPAEQTAYQVCYSPMVENVFNIDQTNLAESRPELYQRLVEENQPRLMDADQANFRLESVDCLVSNKLWICDFDTTYEGEPFYNVREKKVVIPNREMLCGGNKYYSTLFHKLTLSAIDSDMVTKTERMDDGHYDSEHARRILAGELCSLLVCQRYGIRKALEEESLEFRERWMRMLKEHPMYARSVLRDVKESCGLMTVRIDCIQQVFIDKDKDKSDDLREDGESEGIDVNGDGVVDANDVHYSPDRKQGSQEGRGESEEETHKKGGFRR